VVHQQEQSRTLCTCQQMLDSPECQILETKSLDTIDIWWTFPDTMQPGHGFGARFTLEAGKSREGLA